MTGMQFNSEPSGDAAPGQGKQLSPKELEEAEQATLARAAEILEAIEPAFEGYLGSFRGYSDLNPASVRCWQKWEAELSRSCGEDGRRANFTSVRGAETIGHGNQRFTSILGLNKHIVTS